ncbi:unnamed protein product [Plutella xylostella]|uniref:(diamondback moth) hypothetical protein n=1 Tax=Plutella xylostella TaxID=51655 RepID=A0A8S4FYG2_PLUXY|nr:unnamed protein product [Plutella xylostella]
MDGIHYEETIINTEVPDRSDSQPFIKNGAAATITKAQAQKAADKAGRGKAMRQVTAASEGLVQDARRTR